MSENPAPGWYADPHGSGGQRWWDGSQWTDHVQAAQAPAAHPATTANATALTSDAKTWAMAAHLSALPAAFIGLAFVGPLVVYLVKKDEHPFIRQQAAEALNFQLSWLIYMVAWLVSLVLLVGLLLIPVVLVGAVAWLVLTILAGVKANQGEAYRYPLTIRMID